MKWWALLLSLFFAGSLAFGQAGIKARKKPKMKLPMVSVGVYGTTGYALNSDLINSRQAISSAGRYTGNFASATQVSNFYGGGGAQVRHFFHWLDMGYLGLQLGADYIIFENAKLGFNTGGDPKQETLFLYQGHTMISASTTLLLTIFRAARSAVQLGLGSVYSIESFSYTETFAEQVQAEHEFSGSAIGFNVLFSFEYMLSSRFAFFAELHGRLLTITELKAAASENTYLVLTEISSSQAEQNKYLRASTASEPTAISWSQSGPQFKVGCYYYFN